MLLPAPNMSCGTLCVLALRDVRACRLHSTACQAWATWSFPKPKQSYHAANPEPEALQAAQHSLPGVGSMGSLYPEAAPPQGWPSSLGSQGLADPATWGALQGTQAAMRAHQAGFSSLLSSDSLGAAQVGSRSGD